MRAIIHVPEPLVGLHPGNLSGTSAGEVEEEEEEKEGDVEEGAMAFTQESEAPQHKKAMQVATLQSNLIPVLYQPKSVAHM